MRRCIKRQTGFIPATNVISSGLGRDAVYLLVAAFLGSVIGQLLTRSVDMAALHRKVDHLHVRLDQGASWRVP